MPPPPGFITATPTMAQWAQRSLSLAERMSWGQEQAAWRKPPPVAQAAAGGLLGMTLIIRGDADEGYPLLIQGQQALDETDSVWLAAQLISCAVPFLWLEEYDRARQSLERVVARARAKSAPGALVYPLC